ncbi:hypothetical protein R1flu_012662 [Riccia fluitans]|uniref:Ubiquitin-like protease family profile domain-containing protein n=1 Tax=Riccia fluitans TaxID=41844 RepID=A0ABD1ZB81_9MARC
MTDTAIGTVNKPLDIKPQSILLDIILDDENPELEIVVAEKPSEPTASKRKHKHLLQHELDDRIRRYRKLNLPDSDIKPPDNGIKLRRILEELEEENRLRKADQEKLERHQNVTAQENGLAKVESGSKNVPETKAAASKFYTSNGVSEEPQRRVIRTRATSLRRAQEVAESRSKVSGGCTGSESPHSEEIDHANYPAKGKGQSLQPLSITEDVFYDRARNKARTDSGEQAGPSSRQGPRSGQLQTCRGCSRKVSPTNLCSVGTGTDYAVYCPSCSQKQFSSGRSELHSPKHRELDNFSESSDEDFMRKHSGAKRRRSSLDSGEPVGSVVELFSSDEDEDNTEHESVGMKLVRTDQQKRYTLRSTNARRMVDKLAYPSKDDPEAVEVDYQDLQRLAPMEFLNDTIIDFYIKYMQRPECLKPDQKKRFHFFNSFFYKKLFETANSQPSSKKHSPDLSKLRKWTKGTNIFEKDYLFVPIHDKWHWSLAIICNPGGGGPDRGSERFILHLDSMSPGHKSAVVFRLLKLYLSVEWAHQWQEDKNGDLCQRIALEISTKKVQVPQQDNESDCGLFLLHYIHCFLQEAPIHFKSSDLENNQLFGRNWNLPRLCLTTWSRNNLAVSCQLSPDSADETLQVIGHEPGHSWLALEDTQVVWKPGETSVSVHSPSQSSTEYMSVKSSPSTDTSVCDGNQNANGIGFRGSDTDREDSAAVHPVDSETKRRATSEPVDQSQSTTNQSFSVYVELGNIKEMDSSDLEKVEVLKGSTPSAT